MRKIVLFLFLLSFGYVAKAQQISFYRQRLVENWQFLRQDIGGVWEAVRDTRPGRPTVVPIWTDINLPHCFNAEDAVDPDVNYYQGPGWYRTTIEINNPYKNGRTLLYFEGAGQKTNVYLGLYKAGSHVGGYDEWTLDITDLVDSVKQDQVISQLYGEKIPISIRCDNSRDLEMIPSDLSDFNVYGGLYRYVNLIYVPEVYLEQVRATLTVLPKGEKGHILLTGQLNNSENKQVDLKIEIRSSANKLVYESGMTCNTNEFNTTIILDKIKLWSPDQPELYQLSIVLSGEDGEQQYTDKFGFREFHFEKNGPFYLNNDRLLLRGTHRHEDHAGVGAAMTEEMIRKEMKMIKDMGANFIRLGHYQQSRIVLNLCDSLGILVWEEIPWCRGGLGGEVYRKQAYRMLTNMISQHYNHPSVIVWGLGNENDWPGDTPEFDEQAIRYFMSELNDLAHHLDTTRKTAIRRCDFCKDIVDVYSPSIWAGWYRGKYTEYLDVSRKEIEQIDHFLHMEWGASSHTGRHSENPDLGLEQIITGNGADERVGDASLNGGQARVSKDGDWTETYACNLFDWTLKEQEKMPWLTGTAFWVFKDFSTPIRPENPIPYVNQKGVVERDLTPKESYYVFQSYWSDKPMIHIYGHSWPVRWGDSGQSRMVKIYSNCGEVELFLNGKSLGAKQRDSQNFPAAGLHWNVKFQEGLNQLLAVSKVNGQEINDSIKVDYQIEKWGEPVQLELTEVGIDNEFSWLVVKAFDKNHILCLDAKNPVEFSVAGDAMLIDNQGTVNGSRVVQLCNGVSKIKIKRNGLSYSAAVQSDGLETAILYLNTQ